MRAKPWGFGRGGMADNGFGIVSNTKTARDDSQVEPSRALLFSLAESQDVIGFFLYFYTDSLKYLALELKEISICGLIRGN